MTYKPEKPWAIDASGIRKGFILHLQNGLELNVLDDAELRVRHGECVALTGPSGAGKSSLIRAIYGNYRIDAGSVRINHRGNVIDLATASAAEIISIRRHSLGYVSQFLRAIPRVRAIDVVASSAIARNVEVKLAREQAAAMLERLHIPSALHQLPPATFSGGEQQRVNLARTFICDWPALLLDEPTASLDPVNLDVVCRLVEEACSRGSGVVVIVHDPALRDRLADRTVLIEGGRTIGGSGA